jgi:RNA polymerase sigma-70 factor, ECF subfamily
MNWNYVLSLSSAATGDSAHAAAPTASAMTSDAFAAFYERSARSLWAYLARVSGDAALADDLMQESFVRFLCASTPLEGEIDCRRYLFRIASNLLRDHWRRPRMTALEEIPEQTFAATGSAGQIDSQIDCSTVLAPALAQIRPRDRQLLWLAHAENYTHKEIAEITGLGVTSIRLLLFRARKKMARLLEEQPDVNPSTNRRLT